MALVRGGLVALAAGLMLSGCFGGSGGSQARTEAARAGIGVNGHLWRATLSTLNFMPLQSADPWGGVINYDWYINPQAPHERFKVTVLILDSRLRADALSVAVTKEIMTPEGNWVRTPHSDQTVEDIQNAILTRARELNLADAN